MLFFFFKQKTAYEIGTGDWSSDVCSSDLFVGILALCSNVTLKKVLINLHAYMDLRCFEFQNEIGRASCRERV